ncbi:unnamed protein product, partial [Ectocarpus sp. 12 AP-2014]
ETRADYTTTIFAAGVGPDISDETLLDIAGKESNVLSVTNISSLEGSRRGGHRSHRRPNSLVLSCHQRWHQGRV